MRGFFLGFLLMGLPLSCGWNQESTHLGGITIGNGLHVFDHPPSGLRITYDSNRISLTDNHSEVVVTSLHFGDPSTLTAELQGEATKESFLSALPSSAFEITNFGSHVIAFMTQDFIGDFNHERYYVFIPATSWIVVLDVQTLGNVGPVPSLVQSGITFL